MATFSPSVRLPRYLSQLSGVDRPGLHLRDGSDPDALAALLGPLGVSHRMCQMPQRVSEMRTMENNGQRGVPVFGKMLISVSNLG